MRQQKLEYFKQLDWIFSRMQVYQVTTREITELALQGNKTALCLISSYLLEQKVLAALTL